MGRARLLPDVHARQPVLRRARRGHAAPTSTWTRPRARGDFGAILDWLREKVHRRGYLLRGEDLMREVTGRPLGHEAFMRYLTERYTDALRPVEGPPRAPRRRRPAGAERRGRARRGRAERFRSSVVAARAGARRPHDGRPRGAPAARSGLADLRQVWVRHWDFNGRARSGVLIVHEDAAADVVKVCRRLFAARFPMRRMRMVDAYGGSDYDVHRGGQHLGLQLPAGDRRSAAGRSTPTAARSTSTRSRTRTSPAGRRPTAPASRTSTARACGRAWPSRAARSCARSTPWAGAGADAGAAIKDYQHFSTERRLTAPAHTALPL